MLLKIYDKSFVGIKESGLGFLTPYGTDEASLNRQNTVKRWCESGRDSKNPKYKVVENKYASGFKILHDVKRNTENVVWRILDPNGYELELSSPNVEHIIQTCTITKGLIKEKLLWARNKAQNYLLPEGSEYAKTAVRLSDSNATKIDVNDIRVGETVYLANEKTGIYVGVFYILPKLDINWPSYYMRVANVCLDAKRTFVFRVVGDDSYRKYYTYASKPTIRKRLDEKLQSPKRLANAFKSDTMTMAESARIFDTKPKILKDTFRAEVTDDVTEYSVDKDGVLYYIGRNEPVILNPVTLNRKKTSDWNINLTRTHGSAKILNGENCNFVVDTSEGEKIIL